MSNDMMSGYRAGRFPIQSPTMSALKHNSYFDGQVQSVEFERNGRRMTAGVIAPGKFHFDTRAPERMTVTSGEILVRVAGGEPHLYPVGTAFEVPAASGFDVTTTAPAAYLCEFL
jgi:uncharacterized protein YaiE (UPF0345 family)